MEPNLAEPRRAVQKLACPFGGEMTLEDLGVNTRCLKCSKEMVLSELNAYEFRQVCSPCNIVSIQYWSKATKHWVERIDDIPNPSGTLQHQDPSKLVFLPPYPTLKEIQEKHDGSDS